jgi:hypothetical protein
MTERRLLAIPHTSTRDDVYRGFFIPKGRILLIIIVHFPSIIWSKRIYGDSECMVRQVPIHLYIYLKMLQGDPARPRIVPRPGRIQTRAFSQRRWERPRRPGALVSVWDWQEDLSWTSLRRCYNLHSYRVDPLRIQCDESERREWPRNSCQGRDIWSKWTRHVSRRHFCPPSLLELKLTPISRHPEKFECSILPRDKAANDLILANTLP